MATLEARSVVGLAGAETRGRRAETNRETALQTLVRWCFTRGKTGVKTRWETEAEMMAAIGAQTNGETGTETRGGTGMEARGEEWDEEDPMLDDLEGEKILRITAIKNRFALFG